MHKVSTRRFTMLAIVMVTMMAVITTSYAASGRKLWIPLVIGADPAQDNRTTDLRVDNIPSYNLDAALYEFGITNANTRYAIYQWIMNDRNLGGGGTQPDGYPAPQASPDVFSFRQFCGCELGEGFMVGWKSSGHMQSRVRYVDNLLFELWSVGVLCPINLICTVISKRGPTNNTPQPRTLLEYEVRGNGAPVQWINQMCSF